MGNNNLAVISYLSKIIDRDRRQTNINHTDQMWQLYQNSAKNVTLQGKHAHTTCFFKKVLYTHWSHAYSCFFDIWLSAWSIISAFLLKECLQPGTWHTEHFNATCFRMCLCKALLWWKQAGQNEQCFTPVWTSRTCSIWDFEFKTWSHEILGQTTCFSFWCCSMQWHDTKYVPQPEHEYFGHFLGTYLLPLGRE